MVQKTIDGIAVTIDGDEARLLRALKRSEKATENSSKKIDRSTKEIDKSFSKMGKNVLRSAKLVAAGAALVAIPLSLHFKNAARDAEEMESKFDAVFKSSSDDVRKWSLELAQDVNRSQFALRDFASTFQDTFVPLGFARGEAARLSQQLVELAVDVSSFSNKLESDVIRDFQSALVGNSETVRKYGIVITEASLTQEILNSGLAKSKKEITELNKVQARLNIIMKGTTDAQGDAARTAESQANKEKELAAATEELSIVFGKLLAPATAEVTQNLIDMARVTKDAFDDGAITEFDRSIKSVNKEMDELEKKIIKRQQKKSDRLPLLSQKGIEAFDKSINDMLDLLEELRTKRAAIFAAIHLDEKQKRQQALDDEREQRQKAQDERQSLFVKRSRERLKIAEKEATERAAFTKKISRALNILDIEREEERADFIKKIRRDLAVFEIEQQEKSATEAQRIMEENFRIAEQHAMDFSNVFAQSFDDLIFRGAKLGDVLQGLLKDLARMVLFKSILGPISDRLGGAVSGLFGFADGGVMTSGGPVPLRTYQKGGIANTPQVSVHGEGTMAEANIPLPDGRTVPVTLSGGGGQNISIIQNLTFEAPVKDTIAATLQALGPIIQRQTQMTVVNALSGIRT